MSVSDELTRIQGAKTSLKTSITNKGVEVPDTALIDAYPALVDQIQTGGGSTGDDVVFVDFDGTELHTYSKDDFLKLTSLPNNPDHTAENLTAEGWNWSLADAQAYVEEYDRLIIGQTYHTTDGINYFYLEFGTETTINLQWSQTVANGVVIDWGDGSATETNSGTGTVTLSHTYAGLSEPVLTMQSVVGNTLTLGLDGYNIFYTYDSTQYLTTVRLATGVNLGSAFRGCKSLTSITIPNSVTSLYQTFALCHALPFIVIPNSVSDISSEAFVECRVFRSIAIPNSVVSIVSNSIRSCFALTSIAIPSSITSLDSYVIPYCYALTSITIPNSVTSIGSSAFNGCYANITIDLSSATAVPTLNGELSSSFNHPTILVPLALLSDFQSATNWSQYANFMKGV